MPIIQPVIDDTNYLGGTGAKSDGKYHIAIHAIFVQPQATVTLNGYGDNDGSFLLEEGGIYTFILPHPQQHTLVEIVVRNPNAGESDVVMHLIPGSGP